MDSLYYIHCYADYNDSPEYKYLHRKLSITNDINKADYLVLLKEEYSEYLGEDTDLFELNQEQRDIINIFIQNNKLDHVLMYETSFGKSAFYNSNKLKHYKEHGSLLTKVLYYPHDAQEESKEKSPIIKPLLAVNLL